MIGNFDKCFDMVLSDERGYVNNPLDKGGPTKWGITLETLKTWRKATVTPQDVKELTPYEAKEIYKELYWSPMRCDLLPGGLDYATFDAAVNSGTYQASKWLQTALGVTADGVIGPLTMQAVDKYRDLSRGVILQLCSERLRFVLSINSQVEETFERGWGVRVLKVLQTATLMYERVNT